MKAITLWQPWAWLLVRELNNIFPQRAVKRIETRGWKTNYRGKLAIHAAKYKPVDHEVYSQIRAALLRGHGTNVTASQVSFLERGIPSEMFGAVVGTAELVGCVPIESLYGTEYDTPLERACGDWSPGRYGWILRDPILFGKPIPATGRQGLWNWEEEY